MKFFQTSLEKEFEFFVRNIGKLEPAEFVGLARVLGVSTLRGLSEIGLRAEDLKDKSEEETLEIVDKLTVPTDEVLEKMMDKFLSLSKRRRKEINQILKDVQRGR